MIAPDYTPGTGPDLSPEFDLDNPVPCSGSRTAECNQEADWRMTWRCGTDAHTVFACPGHWRLWMDQFREKQCYTHNRVAHLETVHPLR